MPIKIDYPNFNRSILRPSKEIIKPDVSEDIQQTLARLMGWDYLVEQWRPALTDADGRLMVNTSSLKTDVVTQVGGSVGGGSVAVFNNNTSRKVYWLQATGTGDIYISLSTTFTLSSAIKLLPGAMWIDDVYTGQVRIASDGLGSYAYRGGEMT